jgi:hypothetical protein
MTIQERWDGTFAKLDRSAPAQRADENSTDYLRQLSRIGRKYIPRSEQMASVNFAELPDEVVPKFSELMRSAVERNLYRTDNMQPGEMRSVMVVDPNTGSQQRHFVGPTSFVRNPLYGHRDCRRVVRITRPAAVALWEAQDAAAKRAVSGGW